MLITLFRMVLWVFCFIVLILVGFGAVAFITLLERKLLGLSQTRFGPNKVTLFGLLQPLADGLKLLVKQLAQTTFSQSCLFFFSPTFLLILFMLSWTFVLPWNGMGLLLKCPSLFFFSLLGLGAYGVMMSGWSITSMFSKLGALRGMLQSLSFEVALIIVFLFSLSILKSFFFKSSLMSIELFFVWGILWLIVSLMEGNRAPFDLLEGESELISGFNVEMGSSMFVLLFLSEYGMLAVLSIITSVILVKSITIFGLGFIVMMLFIRSCFPRIRYDSLMGLMWQSMLSFSALSFLLSVFFY